MSKKGRESRAVAALLCIVALVLSLVVGVCHYRMTLRENAEPVEPTLEITVRPDSAEQPPAPKKRVSKSASKRQPAVVKDKESPFDNISVPVDKNRRNE